MAGKTLVRKLLIAVEERDHQIACFKEINSGLDYVTRQDWESRVQAWEGDRSKPNPYLLDKTGARIFAADPLPIELIPF
jgi:dethiobiotin synthetase